MLRRSGTLTFFDGNVRRVDLHLGVPSLGTVIGVMTRWGSSDVPYAAVVLDKARLRVNGVSMHLDFSIAQSAAPIREVVMDAKASTLAILTEDDVLLLHSIDRREHLHTLDFRGGQ